MTNESRRIDISNKLNKMGISLTNEGNDAKEVSIVQIGGILMLLSALIIDDNGLNFMSNICGMFTAQKLIETMAFESGQSLEQFLKNLANLGPNQAPPIK